MDFNLGSMGVSLGLSGSNLGFGDGTLANLTSEMAENRSRMLAQGGAGLLLPSSHGVLKQSRSSSEVEVQMDSREESIGTLKLARSHSFSGSHGGSGLLIRNDHGRLSCSPSTSEDALLPSDNASPIAGEPRMISPSYLSPSIRHLTYQQDPYFYKFPGLQMAMARENMNLYDAAVVGRYPFTSAQWAELEHQALIYKYIIHGYPVPEELLLPIRKSVAVLTGLPYGISGVGWGSFNLGAGSSVDAEPGRCRRTDGKKWRCSRPVVPDQKYCERHMHRGRHRSRKAAEAQANSLSQPPPSPSSTSRSVPAAAPLPARANSSQHSSLDLIVQSPHSIAQKPNIIVTSSAQQQYAGGSSLSTKALLHAPASASVTATSLNSAKCSSTSLALPNTHFQIPPQSSLTVCKDQRFVNGLSSLRAEQVLIASEAFGNPCSMMSMEQHQHQHQHQLGSRLSMVPSTRINPWPAQLSKMPSLVPQKPSNNSLYPYHSSLMSLQAQDMQAMVMQDASPLSAYLDQQQQQQAGYFSSNKNNPNPIEDVKSENQPLRHFFDDWPRSRDSSTLSCWPSETDEEKHKSNANASSSSTQLSISITTASDLASANASPSRSNIFSPLRLSMSRAAQDAAAPTDPTHMGLGMALGSNSSTSPHNQSLWFPISCSMDNNPMGGPLAEALQSSTPLVAAAAKRSAGGGGGGGGGLNLLGTGEGGRHDISSPQLESSRLPSPTGVLQKTFGCCFSDSSSSASSPASAKPEAVACDQNLKAHLTCNGSPHVAT